MQNFNTNFKNYYLKQLEKLVWLKKPKTILVKKMTIDMIGFLTEKSMFMTIVLRITLKKIHTK
jgi:hypothetical protein